MKSLFNTPLQTLLAVVLTAQLSGCGGGAGGASAESTSGTTGTGGTVAAVTTSLGCAADLSLPVTAGQRLLNNAWNRAGAGSYAWKQCLLEQRTGNVVAYGWEWDWPATGGDVLAYPEIVIGAKPWDGGAGNDARFPRRIADTPRLLLSYDVQTTAVGERNLAASLWFTRTAQVAADPQPSGIAAELMIWSDYTPTMVSEGGSVTLRGEVTLEGRVWQVWAAENWGGGEAAGVDVRWTFIVYTAKDQRSGTLSVDVRRFIDDAIARGLLRPELYIASLELGNEIVTGSGKTVVRSLSVTVP